MNNSLTLNEAGSLLLGAGLIKIGTDVNIGLILVGIGAAIKIIIAILSKYQIPVGTNPQA
jgi:tetrahydromethanopterin S-methyltransferase subunit H